MKKIAKIMSLFLVLILCFVLLVPVSANNMDTPETVTDGTNNKIWGMEFTEENSTVLTNDNGVAYGIECELGKVYIAPAQATAETVAERTITWDPSVSRLYVDFSKKMANNRRYEYNVYMAVPEGGSFQLTGGQQINLGGNAQLYAFSQMNEAEYQGVYGVPGRTEICYHSGSTSSTAPAIIDIGDISKNWGGYRSDLGDFFFDTPVIEIINGSSKPYVSGMMFREQQVAYHKLVPRFTEGTVTAVTKTLNRGNTDVTLENGKGFWVEGNMSADVTISAPAGKTIDAVTFVKADGSTVISDLSESCKGKTEAIVSLWNVTEAGYLDVTFKGIQMDTPETVTDGTNNKIWGMEFTEENSTVLTNDNGVAYGIECELGKVYVAPAQATAETVAGRTITWDPSVSRLYVDFSKKMANNRRYEYNVYMSVPEGGFFQLTGGQQVNLGSNTQLYAFSQMNEAEYQGAYGAPGSNDICYYSGSTSSTSPVIMDIGDIGKNWGNYRSDLGDFFFDTPVIEIINGSSKPYVSGMMFREQQVAYHKLVPRFTEGTVTAVTKTLNRGNTDVTPENGKGFWVEGNMSADVTISAPAGKTIDAVTFVKADGSTVISDLSESCKGKTEAIVSLWNVTEAGYLDVTYADSVTVTVSCGANGSVTKDGTAVPASFDVANGSSVTLTLVPDAKYVAKAKVNGADYTVTNNQITLTVTEDVAIEVTFERIPDVAPGFAGENTSYTWFKTEDGVPTIFTYHKLNEFNTGETGLEYGVKLWNNVNPEAAVMLPAHVSETETAKAVPSAQFAIKVFGDAIKADQSYTIQPYIGNVTGNEAVVDHE